MEKLVNSSREKNPELGTYIHLCIVLRGTQASLTECRKYFNNLMPKDEYDISEKEDYISYLFEIAQRDPI